MYVTDRGTRTNEIKLELVRVNQNNRYVRNVRPTSRPAVRRPKRKIFLPLVLILLMTSVGVFSGIKIVLADGGTQESVVVVGSMLIAGAGINEQRSESEMGEISLPEVEEQEPKTPLVIIDPGHGGDDDGCSREDVKEYEINLEISLLLAEKLHDMGIDAVLTREDNETRLSLQDRVAMAEEREADLFISIHQNACDEKESPVEGLEVWYSGNNPDSKRLAKLVSMGAVDKTGAKDRGLMESSELYVIRETSMPSCLIETSFLSNKKEREAISDPAYQKKMAAGIAWGIQYYFYPKTMYLTFDDGPSEENTATVLDILKAHDIKATFFVVGENVEKHPEIAKRIVEEGHTIGIHCYHHNYNTLYESVDSYLKDFEAAYQAVLEATGVEVQFFRFPGGSINAYNKNVYEEIIKEMTERGFVYFDWNGSLEDATKKNEPERLLKNARESTLGRKKIVMLAHDIVYNTTLCLEELIESFPDYKMEPITPEVTPIQF